MDLTRDAILALATPFEDGGAGEDPAVISDFDTLVAELAKAEGIEKQTVDFDKVIKLSVNLMTDQTKDLRVIAYLCFGLYNKQAFEGLANGLALMTAVIESDLWEHVYPRRRKRQGKARAAALSWLTVRLDKAVGSFEINETSDHQSIVDVTTNFDQCELAFANKLEDDAPAVFEFKATLRNMKRDAEGFLAAAKEREESQANQETEQVPDAPSQAVAPAVASQAPVAPISHAAPAPVAAKSVSVADGGLDKALGAIGKSLDDVASYHKAKDPFDPSAFYFARLAKWVQIQMIPPSGLMPPIPQPAQIQRLKDLDQQKDYKSLVNEAEAMFTSGAIFCLSIQRYIYTGLIALQKDECAAVILNCTKDHLSRFPDLLDREFNDGSGFVDSQTALWLQQSSGSGESAQGGESVDPYLSVYQEAETAVANGKPKDAVKLLEDLLVNTGSPRDRAQISYYIGKLFFQLDRYDVALSVFNAVRNDQQSLSAIDYDLSLTNDVSSLLLKCYNKVKVKNKLLASQEVEYRQLQQEVFARNPSLALEFTEL